MQSYDHIVKKNSDIYIINMNPGVFTVYFIKNKIKGQPYARSLGPIGI